MSSPQPDEHRGNHLGDNGDAMRGTGEEDEGEGDEIMPNVTDDSSEEGEEDEEEARRIREGFIVDEDDEEEDEEEERQRRRKKRKKHHRRREFPFVLKFSRLKIQQAKRRKRNWKRMTWNCWPKIQEDHSKKTVSHG